MMYSAIYQGHLTECADHALVGSLRANFGELRLNSNVSTALDSGCGTTDALGILNVLGEHNHLLLREETAEVIPRVHRTRYDLWVRAPPLHACLLLGNRVDIKLVCEDSSTSTARLPRRGTRPFSANRLESLNHFDRRIEAGQLQNAS